MFRKINLIFVFLFFLMIIDCKKLRAKKTLGCNGYGNKCGWFRSACCSNYVCSDKIAGHCVCKEGFVYNSGTCMTTRDMIMHNY